MHCSLKLPSHASTATAQVISNSVLTGHVSCNRHTQIQNTAALISKKNGNVGLCQSFLTQISSHITVLILQLHYILILLFVGIHFNFNFNFTFSG
jgi:hypothetical protein